MLSFFRKNTAQGYLATETGNFSLCARPIPKYDVQCQSFTNCLNVIYQSGHKLGSPYWEIGVLPIRCKINKKISKPLLKINKVIFTKI